MGLSPSFFPSLKIDNLNAAILPGPGTYDTGSYRKTNSTMVKFASTTYGYNSKKIENLIVEPEIKLLDIENVDIADLESANIKEKSELEIAKNIIIRNRHNVVKLTPDVKKKLVETRSHELESIYYFLSWFKYR